MPRTRARKYEHIKIEYINGDKTLKELSKKYGLNYPSLQQIAAKEKWTFERNRFLDKITAKTQEYQIDRRVEAISDFNDKCLGFALSILGLAAIIMEEEKDKKPPSALRLTRITKAVKEAQYIGRLAMGASTENISAKVTPVCPPRPITKEMDPTEALELYVQMIEHGN